MHASRIVAQGVSGHAAASSRRAAARFAAGLAMALLVGGPTGIGAVASAEPVKEALRKQVGNSLAAKSFAVAPQATETLVTVVEYYNVGLGHFFITAAPAEIANLDGGAFGGAWKRTGQTFGAWAMAGRPAESVPVCRFFGTDQYRANGTRIGPNSHFYTGDPAECAFVKTAWPSVAADGKSYPAWTYEGDAFALKLPAGGACPAGTAPLYRAYNDGAGGDPNHRYATSPAAFATMAGWTVEGLVMCGPPVAPTVPFTVIGEIRGCNVPECRPPTAAGSGVGLVDVVVEIGVTAAQLAAVAADGYAKAAASPFVRIEFPKATVFVSVSGQHQDGVLQDGVIMDVPVAAAATGSLKVLLSLYCLQMSREPADTSAIYTMQGTVTNPGVLAIVNLPRSRPIVNGSLTATATQFAIWEVTDGKGALTAAQLDMLRTIYSLPEDDPQFATTLADFLASLSVIGPPG